MYAPVDNNASIACISLYLLRHPAGVGLHSNGTDHQICAIGLATAQVHCHWPLLFIPFFMLCIENFPIVATCGLSCTVLCCALLSCALGYVVSVQWTGADVCDIYTILQGDVTSTGAVRQLRGPMGPYCMPKAHLALRNTTTDGKS